MGVAFILGLLAAGQIEMPACGKAQQPCKTQRPLITVVLSMEPAEIPLTSGQELSANYLLQRLHLRLSPLGVQVRQPWKSQWFSIQPWTLQVTSRAEEVHIVLLDPTKMQMVDRIIDINGKSPHAVAHGIALAVAEALTPFGERVATQIPERIPVAQQLAAPAKAADTTHFEVGGFAGGNALQARHDVLATAGLEVALLRAHFFAALSASIVQPTTSSGEDYHQRVVWGLLRSAVGYRQAWGMWELAGDLGLAYRWLRNSPRHASRTGEHCSLGDGGRRPIVRCLACDGALGSRLAAQLQRVTLRRFFG
ncbi:MAG: hypothetical protein R3C68_09840 [Myxococcota bacterium]